MTMVAWPHQKSEVLKTYDFQSIIVVIISFYLFWDDCNIIFLVGLDDLCGLYLVV